MKVYTVLLIWSDLVIEILSPGTEMNDLGDKKNVYEKTGVKEYWIVDPLVKKITVYLLVNNKLEINGVYYYKNQDELEAIPEEERKSIIPKFKSNIFSDLEINLADVFKGMLTPKKRRKK